MILDDQKQPVLYVGRGDESQEAIKILNSAGFDFSIQNIRISDPIAVQFGTPVLFDQLGKFEGVEGVRVFIENATLLSVHSPSKKP
jgi:hypothetical protein